MLILRLLALSLVGYSYFDTTAPVYGRECPYTISSLWIDVAVVIDTSSWMSKNGLIQVISHVGSVFRPTPIGSYEGQHTRVGVVTYDKNATVNFDMNAFPSTDAFEGDIWSIIPKTMDEQQSFIFNGLITAAELLASSKTKNRKKAILVFAYAYQVSGNNVPQDLANSLKSSGLSIIVVSFNQNGDKDVFNGLSSLASNQMFLQYTDNDVVGMIQKMLCQVNCYCPIHWYQLANSFVSLAYKYGECYWIGEKASAWTPAKFACQAVANDGYLVTASTPAKIKYLKNVVHYDLLSSGQINFHVGLKYQSGAWYWEQGSHNATIKADDSVPWLAGYPIDPTNNSCTDVAPYNESDTSLYGLKNINCNSVVHVYMCQMITCDTDNYCE